MNQFTSLTKNSPYSHDKCMSCTS